MPRIGHGGRRLIPGAAWAVLGAFAALAPALALWGFTVDDALISVRYAHHLALGLGWRFNAHGPVTDGVTPLPWPVLLAPFARADLLVVLGRAKVLGLLASVATGAALGQAVGKVAGPPAWFRAGILAVYALSVPVAAYSVSGMETPVCTLLATLAALRLRKPWVVACLAGAAATVRPELAPWAVVLASGAAIASRAPAGRVIAVGLAGAAPFIACSLVRVAAFGHVAPLAVLAKPGDVGQGVAYALAAAVVTLAPVLLVAPRALGKSPRVLVLVVAGAVHFVAIALAGGDWMPFARLAVPVVPSLCVAAALLGEHTCGRVSGIRIAAAATLGVCLLVTSRQVVADGRRVTPDRTALVDAARPILGAMSRVAALDVGWVGASTDADVVDLAGLTDPAIAALPGGHTSKRVGVMLLLSRDPDGVVLYAPTGLGEDGLAGWDHVHYGRVVEQRLAADPVLARHFEPMAWLPLGARGAGYVVLRARRDAPP